MRDRILGRALERFNAEGIEYVGAVEHRRREVLAGYLAGPRNEGFLRATVSEAEIKRMVGLLGLVSRGWIGDAAVSHGDRTTAWSMAHCLCLVSDHFRGIVTDRGAKEMGFFTCFRPWSSPNEFVAGVV